MKLIFLGIGSNLNNPSFQVLLALQKIQNLKKIVDFRASSLYLTEPVSTIPQPDFVNAVCKFRTNLEVTALFEQLCEIEIEMGKKIKSKEASRIIDIDILLYGDEFIQTSKLTIPHPRMLKRLFVLKPLKEITSEIDFSTSQSKKEIFRLQNVIEILDKSERHRSVLPFK
ncbi:MAG: 2-amino-4-hydroxy-6-hydroxymethyldihydropteridine pyrophosphokinase [Chlamydiae bacterium]|nr:2-amino-4-hydroxy-6-hydroxymethyldihydropteridine pyrophosphokinase [Chlamydiota bacterium]